jgi:hypothetical protein
MKKLILYCLCFPTFVFAAEVKKTEEKPFVPTAEEKKIIEDGKKILKDSKNKPKPPKHLQDKMNQSGKF